MKPSNRYRSALAAALLLPTAMFAQVSIYEFSQSVQPYVPITEADGGVALGAPTFQGPHYNNRCWVNNPFNDPAGNFGNGYLGGQQGPGYPIGFNFTFNGDVFDVLGISQSGWIGLGKSSDGLQAVWVYNIDHPHGKPFVQYYGGPTVPYKRNRIAAWAHSAMYMRDNSPLVPPGSISSVRVATIGTAPNRVCVVQFADFLGAYPPSESRINFQIRLNEADNSVDVRYGQVLFNYINQGDVQVGLGGRIPEDFNSRKIVYEEPAFLYDWNYTVRATENTEGCTAVSSQFGNPNGSGIPPVVGLNFKWTPPVCPPPVWPVTIGDITFSSAVATWEPNAAPEYEYFVSTENSITGPEVASGTTPDPEAAFEELEPGTTYYVFIRGLCDDGEGTWSLATVFETYRGGLVECNGGVVTEDYCSNQYEQREWMYISSDGSPLRIEFDQGTVGGGVNASFGVWLNGASQSGAPNQTFSGQLDDHALQSSNGQIYIRLITDAGACHAQPWYNPLQWRVGCKNCTDPLVNFTVVEDCANMQYSVVANFLNLGSATTIRLDNNLGVPTTEVTTAGVHTAGPFPAGSAVVVTAQNVSNLMCYSASAPLINDPCAVVDCGPTHYTYCYGDDELHQWSYQGAGTEEIGVRFLRGTVGIGDRLRVYNSASPLSNDYDDLTWGGMLNALFTSGGDNIDRTLLLELLSDGAHSCADEDPLYGTSLEWEYVVACYDGCVQPVATFTGSCLSQAQFEVAVNITEIGSTGSVAITNTGGLPTLNVTTPGVHTVGPFTAGQPVTIELVGANILCTWTSPSVNPDCSTVGVEQVAADLIRVYPNPNNGRFELELPATMSGASTLRVLDLAGRVVATEQLQASGRVSMELPQLTNGLYTVQVENQQRMYIARISIQH